VPFITVVVESAGERISQKIRRMCISVLMVLFHWGWVCLSVSMFHDVAYFRYPEHLQKGSGNFMRNGFHATWLTDHIITVSGYQKMRSSKRHKVRPEKISVVYKRDHRQLSTYRWSQKSGKNNSQGRPYFISRRYSSEILTWSAFEFQIFLSHRMFNWSSLVVKPGTQKMSIVPLNKVNLKMKSTFPGMYPSNAVSLVASAELWSIRCTGFGSLNSLWCTVICSNVSPFPKWPAIQPYYLIQWMRSNWVVICDPLQRICSSGKY
jgi:hypothetical protein